MPVISVNIHSFGYGYGQPPSRAAYVADVRTLLRNPHGDPAMRELTGRDIAVRDHVMNTPGAREFVTGAAARIRRLLPSQRLGASLLLAAIGCSGGRHRAPVLAEAVAVELERLGIGVEVFHRDIDRAVLPPR